MLFPFCSHSKPSVTLIKLDELETQRCLEGSWIEEEIKRAGRAGDQEIRGKEGVEGAAFAIVHGDGDAAGFLHRAKKQAVVIAVAEGGDVPHVEFLHEVALFDVLPFLFQHVWDNNSSQLRLRHSISVGGDDFQIDEFHQAAQTGPYSGRQFAVE